MVYMVYVTASNESEALKLAEEIVKERLAACANVYPRIKSVYWWEGKLQTDEEVSIIFKTSPDKLEKLVKKIKEIHSYECPCVLAWPVEKGHNDFLEWVLKEIGSN